ncbi:MAG: RICIN domain-containing protein [Candidatus Thiodiazotropha sp.]|jgi:pectin lyase
MKIHLRLFIYLIGLSLCMGLAIPVKAKALNDGVVSSIVGANTDLCLGVKDASNSNTAIVQSQTCSGSDYQRWQMKKDSANYFIIKNIGSGKCLDIPAFSTNKGTVLQQWSCTGNSNQKWNISDQGNGEYAIISQHSNLAMDVYRARKSSGVSIIQWSWKGSNNQKWIFPDESSSGGALSGGADNSDGAVGFGAGVTGGKGGSVVTVSTAADLKRYIADDTPRIIRISGSIDFRNSEGKTTELGCTYSDNSCSYNGKQEKILDDGSHCSGRSLYNITYDTAGKTPLQIGSNKTLIGVGANSGIKGKGFRMAGEVSNIIIRNLSITDINDGTIWGGDAITITGASNIWIDHNYIARIARQFIVTGYDTAKNITISGNYFNGTTDYGHYCNRRHYWNLLFDGKEQTISFIGNRVSMTSGRAPQVNKKPSGNWTAGMLHMVNNYFDNNYGTGFEGYTTASILMEGNYFEQGDNFSPVSNQTSGILLYAPIGASINSSNSICQSILGRNCSANYDGSDNGSGNFVINSAAMSSIQKNSNWLNAVRSVTPKSYSEVASQAFGPQSNISY